MTRLETLSACSEAGPGVTRLPFTSEHRAANGLIGDWMKAAGLSVGIDAAGTMIGRREGTGPARTLLLGSHQDSVPHGGRYDGALGVILPLVVLESLKDEELPFAVELLAFADEEGVRFPTALIGPRSLAGTLDPAVLDLEDGDGTSLADAMRTFQLDPVGITDLKRRPEDVIGFVEVHIEQGPVLEDRDIRLGVVSAICGIERWSVEITGRAAHAGTTPMELRQDALAAASEAVLAVEDLARRTDDLVGVVGNLNVSPNAVNAVPGKVDFTIELRSGTDAVRHAAGEALSEKIDQLCAARGLAVETRRTYSQPAVQCDRALSDSLQRACKASGTDAPILVSGATHDASAMSDLAPVAMMFVRCKQGISHHPDESITAEDAAAAASALQTFLRTLSDTKRLRP